MRERDRVPQGTPQGSNTEKRLYFVISRILETLGAFIISVISTGGYPGIIALMAVESACIPLPSEVIIIAVNAGKRTSAR